MGPVYRLPLRKSPFPARGATLSPVRILIDIIHPAHVHFFKHPVRMLLERGHAVRITSRDKDCTLALLDTLGLEHRCLSRQNRGGMLAMARELFARDVSLARVARAFRPDVMGGIGGVCIAQVGRLCGIPSVVFYDTENATLQNALTYPFATSIVVPECYTGWTPRRKTVRYRGYHELAYLHPAYFTPDRDIAIANGLAADGDTFIVRVVSWRASHDLGVNGWSTALLEAVIARLAAHGKVLISAEGPLPPALDRYRFEGDAAQIHHVLAFCRAYVGESATMASEAVVLGVPAVYAATVSRGYVDEQAQRYRLAIVSGIASAAEVMDAVDRVLAMPAAETGARHRVLLGDTIDVAAFVADTLTQRRDR